MNKNKAGMTLGMVFSFMHLVWLLLIATGTGQWYLDFIFGLHHLTNPFTVMPINWGRGIMLLIITYASGYVVGWLYAYCWNSMQRQ